MESDRPNPLHIISTRLITLLITFLSNDSFVTHSVDIRTTVTQCHDGPGLHHFTRTTQVSMVLVSTTSSIPDKLCFTVSMALVVTTSSSRLHDLNHLTLRFSSLRGCASFTVKTRCPRVCLHWLLHKTLLPSNQNHFHQVHQFPYPVARKPLRSDVSNV